MAPREIFRAAGKFRKDQRGAILVFVALVLTVVLGFAGLGVETGLWYSIKRHEQTAADYAALSGAIELAEKGYGYYTAATAPALPTGICGMAKRAAKSNGFPLDASFACPGAAPSPACTNPAAGQMCVNNPPSDDASNKNAVEVILAQQQNTVFASLFLPSVTIRSRAVAELLQDDIACSLATYEVPTNGNPDSTAINFSGNSASFNGCGFVSNSTGSKSINFQGSTTVGAQWFQSAGSYNTNGNPSFPVQPVELTYTSPVTDPYSCAVGSAPSCGGQVNWAHYEAMIPKGGKGELSAATPGTLQPGVYQPMDFAAGTYSLCPGVYVVDGEDKNKGAAFNVGTGTTVTMASACGTGDGVTIIATSSNGKGGGFYLNGGTVNLTAPNPSPDPTNLPSGLLFAQDPNEADTKQGTSDITATAADSLLGAIYTPVTSLKYTGNSTSTCFIIIADTILYTGTSSVSGSASTCQAAGVSAPSVLHVVMTE